MSEKKKKNNSVNMNRWLFLALWIFSHIFAWSGTFLLIDNLDSIGDEWWLILLVMVTFFGIIPGALLAFPQKWLMKKGLGLDLQWWRRVSVGAWILGGFLLWIILYLAQNYRILDEPSIPLIILTWFGPLVLGQYFLMRQHIQKASLFALANMASVIIFAQFVGIYEDATLLRFASSGALQGAVTGLTLLWLYGMGQEEKSKQAQAQDDTAIERLSNSLDENYQLEDSPHSTSKQSSS